MACQILDIDPASFVFDRSHPSLQRDRLGQYEERHPDYDSRYDFQTLFYDAYFDQEAGEVVLIAPMLLNFRGLVERAEFAVDGTPVTLKEIGKLSRGNVIRFDAPGEDPREISFKHPLFEGKVELSRAFHDAFRGRNAIYAISKDNSLTWIRDWLHFYVEQHGANAVVLFDNHSTAYDMEALKETLCSVPGIEVAALVRAWFPFGPGGVGNTNFNSKFLHMTMVELGRQRLLKYARAVLNVDIDELVHSRDGRSIFDAAWDSDLGYVRLRGKWVFAPAPKAGNLIRHADHRFVRAGDRLLVHCKWCVVPQGKLKDRLWLTHRVSQHKIRSDPNFGFWHFRRISSNWDYDREDFDEKLLVEDGQLVETMARFFGSGAGQS